MDNNSANRMYVLAHSNIKGSKWGQRRFRNYDGTLTEEGKIRYAQYNKEKNDTNTNVAKTASRAMKDASEAIPQVPRKKEQKNYSDLTNKDLQDRINRLKLEDEYGRLSGDTKYKKSGAERAKNILSIVGSATAAVASVFMIRSLMLDNKIKKQEIASNDVIYDREHPEDARSKTLSYIEKKKKNK